VFFVDILAQLARIDAVLARVSFGAVGAGHDPGLDGPGIRGELLLGCPLLNFT
jgi:hypothetical protein